MNRVLTNSKKEKLKVNTMRSNGFAAEGIGIKGKPAARRRPGVPSNCSVKIADVCNPTGLGQLWQWQQLRVWHALDNNSLSTYAARYTVVKGVNCPTASCAQPS